MARPPRWATTSAARGSPSAARPNQAPPRRRSAPTSASGNGDQRVQHRPPGVAGRATSRPSAPDRWATTVAGPGSTAAATSATAASGHGEDQQVDAGRGAGDVGRRRPSSRRRPTRRRARAPASEPPGPAGPMTRVALGPSTASDRAAPRPRPRRPRSADTRSGARSRSGASTNRRCHMRGWGTSRSGSATWAPSTHRTSTSRVRGPHRSSRTRSAAGLEAPAHGAAAAGGTGRCPARRRGSGRRPGPGRRPGRSRRWATPPAARRRPGGRRRRRAAGPGRPGWSRGRGTPGSRVTARRGPGRRRWPARRTGGRSLRTTSSTASMRPSTASTSVGQQVGEPLQQPDVARRGPAHERLAQGAVVDGVVEVVRCRRGGEVDVHVDVDLDGLGHLELLGEHPDEGVEAEAPQLDDRRHARGSTGSGTGVAPGIDDARATSSRPGARAGATSRRSMTVTEPGSSATMPIHRRKAAMMPLQRSPSSSPWTRSFSPEPSSVAQLRQERGEVAVDRSVVGNGRWSQATSISS